MATEQIQTSQIAGSIGSGQVATQFITLSGGSGDKTTSAFSFVVGPVMIELLHDGSDNGVNVYSVLWVNMRSFSGTKTADVTNRIARGPGNGGFLKMEVDRTTSGTVLVIGRPNDGTDTLPDATGVASFVARNWPGTGRLRITAWEDTQA